ncbi:MAG: ATP-binding protein [Pyrinomonadaceae bacterium]|nr:ATP-binding protein [Pyrinomonadaceae bacterium]
MKPLPLHLKISLIASIISFVVLVVGYIIICANIAGKIQEKEKELAKLQAKNLAEQLSISQEIIDSEELQRLTNTISGSRPNLVTVRIWKLENDNFVEVIGSEDSLPVEEINAETKNALINKNASEVINQQSREVTSSLYRVFSPIVINNTVTGAVETTEKLDTISTIAISFLANLSWITLITFLLMTTALYLVLQRLVYHPLENLLAAIETAKKGDLKIGVAVRENPDEFGKLSGNFNQMMSQIRQMTNEREQQNEILREKVKEATAELVDKNEQLETANLELFHSSSKMSEMERLVAVGQTAAQFAHEVGTPLNLISGHVQLLQSSLPENSPESKRLQTITTQIERIEKIVREMLDRTRFGKTEHTILNLNQVLKKTLEAVEPILAESKVKLITEFEQDLPGISGNSERLQQVFLNLIKNSMDAMPNGGAITISTFSTQDQIKVEFTDNGIGMSQETVSKIFQPLFTTKERGHGTGLGLVIVKQILDEHNAQIKVESQSGAGAKFSLIFLIH